jgi:hypothetical protein
MGLKESGSEVVNLLHLTNIGLHVITEGHLKAVINVGVPYKTGSGRSNNSFCRKIDPYDISCFSNTTGYSISVYGPI